MNTVFMLLAEFGTAQIPLETICKQYFDMEYPEARKAASKQLLPVPVIRLGSQKSPWIVHVNDLAAFIDAQLSKARNDHRRMHAA